MAKKKELGKVTHWYDKISVAVVKLNVGLKKGDQLVFKKGEKEFEATVDSLQIDRVEVKAGKKGDEVAMKLPQEAREGTLVFKGK